MNLINKLKKKRVKWYERDRIPALDNALRNAVYQDHKLEGYINSPFTMLAQEFLGCGIDECYTLNVAYPREVDMHLMPFFEKMINEKYTSHNKAMSIHLKSILGDRGLRDIFYYSKYIGFSHKSYIDDAGIFHDYLSSGTYFIENSFGIKIALNITSVPGMGPFERNNQFCFNLYANNDISGGKEACADFIKTMNSGLNSRLTDSACAMSANGIPVMIKRLAWDDLKISHEIKREINFHIMDFVSRIESFREAGIKPSRGIIIAGSPGNGKTMLGKILCTNLNIPFFIAGANDFQPGMNSVKIEKLYSTASMYSPSIVYIEDADIFLQQRQYNFNGYSLSGFLNLIDGLKENNGVITIVTCNNPELLDEAVKNRPKRFDTIIEFPNPPMEQRLDILNAKLKKYIKPADLVYLSAVASRMDGFSGAHITEFADRLIMSKIYSDSEFINSRMIDDELENFSFTPSSRKTIGIH